MAPAGYPVLPGTWLVFFSKPLERYFFYMAPRKFMSGPCRTCPHVPMHSPHIHARALRADSSGVFLVRARAACAKIIRDARPLRWLAGWLSGSLYFCRRSRFLRRPAVQEERRDDEVLGLVAVRAVGRHRTVVGDFVVFLKARKHLRGTSEEHLV